MARLIDVMHQGRDRVIGAWALDGVVVDPGPEPCVNTLLEALGAPPRALLLTHIHLDHAGAAGALVRRFPDLHVYVHEVGAPHLVDPARLLASAERLYGEAMERLWGDVVPVPEGNIEALRGGERVEGFRVAHCPGHASHHVCYLHERTGAAYVGDVAGVRVPPHEVLLAPTPPPDIDLEAWAGSLETVAGWRPEVLRLTHFGEVGEVEGHLERFRAELRRVAELARRGDRERFLADLRGAIREGADDAGAERLELAIPPEQSWLGLERYWRKRRERSEAASEVF